MARGGGGVTSLLNQPWLSDEPSKVFRTGGFAHKFGGARERGAANLYGNTSNSKTWSREIYYTERSLLVILKQTGSNLIETKFVNHMCFHMKSVNPRASSLDLGDASHLCERCGSNPGVELRENLKSIFHRCHLCEVAFVLELTR